MAYNETTNSIFGGFMMELDKKALGVRISQYREKRGITQMKLAEDLDVSPTHVSYMEKGKRGLTLERLILVANVLHVSTDQLLVDYLENTIELTSFEFADLLSDCSEYERRVLLKIVTSAKTALRDNRYLR
jgi:transcriptional regulator with XRE-family HTH domain